MMLADAQTGLAAAVASTGQQKALLIGVILGHAALLLEARGFAPLLLLDEPLVHLDAMRREALFAAVAALAGAGAADRNRRRPVHCRCRPVAEGLRLEQERLVAGSIVSAPR